ncbi:MAG: hypothetical protein M3Z24_10230 [Chloroflexota bacterium]|nr:hypothetical protein [Chloroflexota bacterium]
MKQRTRQHLQGMFIGIVGLALMALFTACAGVNGSGTVTGTGTGTPLKITGQVQTTSSASHSVTLTYNGQQYTITGLSDQQVAMLQARLNKIFTISATQNSDNSYTITNGTAPVDDEGTPNVPQGVETETSNTNNTNDNGVNEPGSINFIGRVQSSSSTSLIASTPDGRTLTMKIVSGQTNLGDNNVLPANGQLVKVEATANTDGSFTATKVKAADNGDIQNQSEADYQGVATRTVGSDNVLHFKVGNRSYSFAIASGADLGDFNGNAHSINANQPIKVKVTFQNGSGTVQKVSN